MKTVCLYCNWKVKPSVDGFYIEGVHATYLNAFLGNRRKCKVCLLSNVSDLPINSSDVFIEYEKVALISLPAFSSYISAIKCVFDIYSGVKRAYGSAEFFYIRTPEPFSWLFGMHNLLGRKVINYHVASNPLNVIWGDKQKSYLSRAIRYGFFLPEYFFIMISAYFNHISCNGHYAKKTLPFFLNKKTRVLIESTKVEADFEGDLIIRDFSSNPECVNILVVTRLFPAKGLDVLIKAFSETHVHDRCKLIIAGDGPELNSIKSMAVDFGVGSRVEFMGHIKNGTALNKLYSQCHFFINPSLSETGPRVLLEAMAYNLYCISTDVGYARYVLSDKEGNLHGHIITPGSVSEMASAIFESVHNFSACMEVASQGRSLSKRFTLESFVESILSVDD
ncbi:glycosyltransferase involved in cell wall biosynthesis [Aeromonas caviae]|uniref:glycosyltransferase family 4 protein n=1 Tax=Aeromonas caviae TaxID=648 RepID=UPI00209D8B23|nr:glycosyltransferase family 4 protein [Aeromonas caviae]MCP1601235.1 glycosyltransferase involved in cell wall biosynthesis [Aeromonas caviae]